MIRCNRNNKSKRKLDFGSAPKREIVIIEKRYFAKKLELGIENIYNIDTKKKITPTVTDICGDIYLKLEN